MRLAALAALAALTLLLVSSPALSQERIERRMALDPDASIKAFIPAGSVRVIGWDRDSLVVTGTVAKGARFSFGGGRRGVKFEVGNGSNGGRRDDAPLSRLTVYLPRGSQLSLKSASADIDGTDVSGWFYTVGGRITLRGVASAIEAEAMGGDVTLAVSAPWVRARTGSGAIRLGGRVQDAAASSISGRVEIASAGLAASSARSPATWCSTLPSPTAVCSSSTTTAAPWSCTSPPPRRAAFSSPPSRG
jgi:hypothetical protein